MVVAFLFFIHLFFLIYFITSELSTEVCNTLEHEILKNHPMEKKM